MYKWLKEIVNIWIKKYIVIYNIMIVKIWGNKVMIYVIVFFCSEI